jgi:hypothetical protein
MFYDQLAAAIERAARNQLDDLSSQVWRAYGAGTVDDRAHELQEMIQRRRQPVVRGLPPTVLAGPPKGYFIQRSAEQRSPDRAASIARRRMHAASGAMPPQLAAQFTIAEQAVCRVAADEFLAHGVCDLSRNELGSRAGVCHTVAERTMLKIEKLKWIEVERRPRSGRKHLTNLTRIVNREWLAWLARGNRKVAAVKSCGKARPDFRTFRGAQKSLPRSADFKNSRSAPVDNTVKKRNRTGAGRDGL